MAVSGDETNTEDRRHTDLAGWLAGRRSEVERWVEVACKRAIVKARTVAADEIRVLGKRVDRMHELIDHLEHIVESQEAGEEGEAPASAEAESAREPGDERG